LSGLELIKFDQLRESFGLFKLNNDIFEWELVRKNRLFNNEFGDINYKLINDTENAKITAVKKEYLYFRDF
jgi:hypothetical protein